MRHGVSSVASTWVEHAFALPGDGMLAERAGGRWTTIELKSLLSGRLEPRQHRFPRREAASTHFSFRDRWQVNGQIEEVAQTLLKTEGISTWWPQLAGMKVASSGNEVGAGRTFVARASGFLPYELAIDFRVIQVCFPEKFSVEITGDLCGHGGGQLRQTGPRVAIDFDLTVRVNRPILRFLSLLARPALCAQHRWVMRQGELGLRKTMEGCERVGANP